MIETMSPGKIVLAIPAKAAPVFENFIELILLCIWSSACRTVNKISTTILDIKNKDLRSCFHHFKRYDVAIGKFYLYLGELRIDLIFYKQRCIKLPGKVSFKSFLFPMPIAIFFYIDSNFICRIPIPDHIGL